MLMDLISNITELPALCFWMTDKFKHKKGPDENSGPSIYVNGP